MVVYAYVQPSAKPKTNLFLSSVVRSEILKFIFGAINTVLVPVPNTIVVACPIVVAGP